ncbi:MAG: cytochrome C oxidase subunit IV family protein [Polyangiales bacterium]
MSARFASTRALTLAWLALVALAAGSLALSRVHLGAWGAPLAMGIAAVKAAVIALWFMELGRERFSSRGAVALAVGFVLLLAGFASLDVASRATPPARPPVRAEVSP